MIPKRTLIHLSLLLLAVGLVFHPALSADFVWDDQTIIVENPLLKSGAGLFPLLLAEDTFPGTTTGYYRPVTYLSFYIDRLVWGGIPFGFHLVNLLLHGGVVVLFYFFLKKISTDERLPFIAAILFAIHPVTVETVSFLSGGRNTLLAAVFMLGAFVTFQRGKRWLAVFLFALSVFSKEFGMLLPLMLVIHDRTLGERNRPLRYYLPYLLVVAAYLGVRYTILDGHGLQLEPGNLPERLLTTPVILARYLGNLVLPVSLKIPYDLHLRGMSDPLFLGSVAALSAVLCLLFSLRRNRFVVMFSCWWIVFLLPVLNVVPLGDILMADRYAYFSAMGFVALVAYVLCRAGGGLPLTVTVVVAISYGIISFGSTASWANNHALYSRMIKDAPKLSRGYHNLGVYYLEKGDVLRAAGLMEQAIAARTETTESHLILSSLYLEMNEPEKARRLLEETVSRDDSDFKSHMLLNRIYRQRGDERKASLHGKRAEELMPGMEIYLKKMAEKLTREAVALQTDGQYFKAERLYRKVLLYEPGYVAAIIGLGGVMAEQGKVDAAIGLFSEARGREPDNPIPHFNLSLAYRLKGREKEAADEFARYSSLKHTLR